MFDPYHKWLGIPPKDQPPNYYRLLAIDAFESDPEVIDAAANRQMAYVQQRSTGEHMSESQKLLNELAAARLCLLDKKKKAAYDLQLKVNLRLQARRAGGSQEKQSKPAKSADKKSASLTDRALAPPVIGAHSPSSEDTPHKSTPFAESVRRMRVIAYVLGGGLLLVMTLIIFVFILPGPEKETKTIADPADSKAETGGAKGNRPEMQRGSAGTAFYDVEINPSSATITIQNNMGIVSGTGKSRQIRFDNIPWRSYVLLTASNEGYKPYTQLLAPRAGQNQKLSIELQRDMPTAPENGSRINNTPQPMPKIISNIPPSNTNNQPNNPPNNPPAKINRPIDVRTENVPRTDSVPSHVETPKTERRNVYVFAGEAAIVTQVQRVLPSTVEAWIWCPAPAENSDMYVFGSDNARLAPMDSKQSNGALGVRIGKDGQLGGRRTQKNKDLRDFWTGEFLPIQKWTHLAVTFDDDKICFFVDGRLIHTDKGAQKIGTVPAAFVIGYLGVVGMDKYNPKYAFEGKIRAVRISSGIRYVGEFRPQFDFNKNQDKEEFKSLLIYDASNGRTDTIPDLSGNKKDGKGLNIRIVEDDCPIQ
jgi:Concanavalin A-like lectin/glucanases superfamily